jgi:hypothetical protein
VVQNEAFNYLCWLPAFQVGLFYPGESNKILKALQRGEELKKKK